jgi:hypothetical protein
MAELQRPTAYLNRLRFCERAVKSASFRHDKNLAIRELCEGVLTLIETLIAEAERTGVTSQADRSGDMPAP